MPKGKIFKTSLLMLILIFCMHLVKPGHAQKDCDRINIPTNPGNANYTSGWLCQCPPEVIFEFDDDSTPDTITSGDSIDVYITGGCAPFTYEVSGTGYTWNGNGSSSYESSNRIEQLDCVGGS